MNMNTFRMISEEADMAITDFVNENLFQASRNEILTILQVEVEKAILHNLDK